MRCDQKLQKKDTEEKHMCTEREKESGHLDTDKHTYMWYHKERTCVFSSSHTESFKHDISTYNHQKNHDKLRDNICNVWHFYVSVYQTGFLV